MSSLHQLLETLPQVGTIEWIGLRPGRRQPMLSVNHVLATPGGGLEGDRYQGRSGDRHATLIQAEHLPVIASLAGLDEVSPALLRRNIVVRGLNLLALRDKIVRVGAAEMLITGLCHPCSRMEQLLGPGGYNAVRGHGGVTARVLKEGLIELGDRVFYENASGAGA